MDRPRVVCLCGSTKFKDDFERVNRLETLEGAIVLAPGVFIHRESRNQPTAEQKAALDELHLRKIDMCDEVVVINVNDYVGESTSKEIEYASSIGRPVRFAYTKCEHCDGGYTKTDKRDEYGTVLYWACRECGSIGTFDNYQGR